ncbi:MAG: hypothetical protein AB8I56_08155, partial [Anaerolineales bacterium]
MTDHFVILNAVKDPQSSTGYCENLSTPPEPRGFIAFLIACVMSRLKAARNDRLLCHPERSEGSP